MDSAFVENSNSGLDGWISRVFGYNLCSSACIALLLAFSLTSCDRAEEGKHRTMVKIKGQCLAFDRTESSKKLKGRYGGSLYWFDHTVELDGGIILDTDISFQGVSIAAVKGTAPRHFLRRRCEVSGTIHGLDILVNKGDVDQTPCYFNNSEKVLQPSTEFPEISHIFCHTTGSHIPQCSIGLIWETWRVRIGFSPLDFEHWRAITSSVLKHLNANAEVKGKC